jgi:signal transduction histidine kinase/ActR/RegA family two-component response regulator
MAPPAPLPEETAAVVAAAAAGRRTDSVPLAVDRPGTRALQLVASASPITDREGNVEGVLLLLDDVTDRQQLEQHVRQAERLGAMARLAGGVAHDFNNLLTVIRGYSEVLLKTLPAGDERRDDVDAILDAAHRAAELTKQLLAIGRRPVLEPEVLDLHRHVEKLGPVLQRLVGDDVDLRVVTSAEAGTVRVDPGDLDQAVMNLVINARDAMPDGGRIMVETRTVELRSRGASLAGVTAGRYVLVTVADTGSGMAPEIAEHCFDPFFTTKGRGRGTGLGLAAVYGTATQAGGHATVESAVGRGTTFRMWLPEVEPAQDEAPAPAVRGVRSVARRRRMPFGSKRRVLLVEDEAPVRTLARVTLEEAGYEVLEAASAEEATARLAADGEGVHVLVSDVVLGGMTGDELAVRLRRRQPGLRVVLMSGFTEQALQLEPDAFLAKPFPFDELVAAVGQLVGPPPPAEAPAPAGPTARSGSPRPGR